MAIRLLTAVEDVMARRGLTYRECTVEIENKCSEFTLCNPQVYVQSGFCKSPLAPTLGPSESSRALFTKTAFSARGAVGVFTYDLQNKSKEDCLEKVAVLFSVPYDYIQYCNLYAVGVFDQDTRCDESLFDEMCYSTHQQAVFVRGKAKDTGLAHKGGRVTVRATMSDSATSVLKVQVCIK
ncbi:DELTA-thalatoxin-Avl1b [Etheostoma spectabile]|uniref:DELTA-thalatoxin-Avl1b n=1 Tax=Etheostoma spectabile TaxID=54343 RepID=UPI0013AEA517|nr:DELTA-thalatoxin-Avl1b-like [Etheostoma spectabile]